ncbi:MAG: hypothetical protein ICV66_04230, partial [Chitinophagaceae bacterium]|nr:hypothetical protein [Chitinophagaceae bacterium]
MKTPLPLTICLLLSIAIKAQITTPIIKANFGVDADLRANYFNGLISLTGDDWFNNSSLGSGISVIDTTGAASIVSRYATDLAFRRQPFIRRMAYPQYSVVNTRLLMDAAFIREYHGDDSTIFASGSNKNAMSPANWSCPVSQQIPDKNDILDMFVHLRRTGTTTADSLWMFGGLS